MEFDEKKLDALVKKLKAEQEREKPFFSYSRDVCHKDEPCHFCGFTGRVHGEGRYIYSPLALMEDLSDAEVMKAAILFCGKCSQKIEDSDKLEMDFE